ncbi:STAS domain-containing protein [Streptomyces viridiviolaceus]
MGLGMIVAITKRIRAHEGSLCLTCVNDRVIKIFRICDLRRIYAFHDSVDQATQHARSAAVWLAGPAPCPPEPGIKHVSGRSSGPGRRARAMAVSAHPWLSAMPHHPRGLGVDHPGHSGPLSPLSEQGTEAFRRLNTEVPLGGQG